jgi:hypothetical protein
MFMLAKSGSELIRLIGSSERYQIEAKDPVFMGNNPSKDSFNVSWEIPMFFPPQAPRGKGELCWINPVLSGRIRMEVMDETKTGLFGRMRTVKSLIVKNQGEGK